MITVIENIEPSVPISTDVPSSDDHPSHSTPDTIPAPEGENPNGIRVSLSTITVTSLIRRIPCPVSTSKENTITDSRDDSSYSVYSTVPSNPISEPFFVT